MMFYYPSSISLHLSPLSAITLVTYIINNVDNFVYNWVMEIALALIAFIYFYALKWDDIPDQRKWVVYLIPILIIALAISWGYQSIGLWA